MNKQTKEREEEQKPKRSTSLTSCYGDCNEIGAGSGEASCSSSQSLANQSGSHKSASFHRSIPHRRSENGTSGVQCQKMFQRGWLSMDQERYNASTSFSNSTLHGHSGCCNILPTNGALSEAEHRQRADTSSKESCLIEVNRTIIPPASDYGSSVGDDAAATSNYGVLRGATNRFLFMRPLPTAESTASSAVLEMLSRSTEMEQMDAGYMEEIDAFLESSESPAARSSGNTRGGGSAAIHFSFDLDAGAAGGVGFEDLGDFIDADIPRKSNGSSQFSSRSNDSMMSSFEELAAGAVVTDISGIEKDDSMDSLRDGIVRRTYLGASKYTVQSEEKPVDFAVNNLNQLDRQTKKKKVPTATLR